MNARHSAADPDWYTDPRIIEAARQAMGSIELDPMSDPVANEAVRAARIFTIAEDGLAQPWCSTALFLNPAGGQVGAAWNKLMQAFHANVSVREAIWVGFSLEQLQVLQNQSTSGLTPMDFPMCVPSSRIPFVENAAKKDARRDAYNEKFLIEGLEGRPAPVWKEKCSPTHANYITYLGDRYARFEHAFRPIGACRK